MCLAVDDDCQLTQPLGYNMAEFPLAPMFARMLLTSGTCWSYNTYSVIIVASHVTVVCLLDTFGCSEEVVTIAAMLQVHHVFNQSTRQKAAAVSQIQIIPDYMSLSSYTHCVCVCVCVVGDS